MLALLLLLLLLLQVHDLQTKIMHEQQEQADLRRKADDKEERAAKVGSRKTTATEPRMYGCSDVHALTPCTLCAVLVQTLPGACLLAGQLA
jgi:hypothetical protein